MFIYQNKVFKSASEALDDYIRNFCFENYEHHEFSLKLTKENLTNKINICSSNNLHHDSHKNNRKNHQKHYPISILKNSKKNENSKILETTFAVASIGDMQSKQKIEHSIELTNEPVNLNLKNKESTTCQQDVLLSFDVSDVDKILREIKQVLN